MENELLTFYCFYAIRCPPSVLITTPHNRSTRYKILCACFCKISISGGVTNGKNVIAHKLFTNEHGRVKERERKRGGEEELVEISARSIEIVGLSLLPSGVKVGNDDVTLGLGGQGQVASPHLLHRHHKLLHTTHTHT